MATRRQLVDMNLATLATHVPRLARWLINDLAGETGPGWKIVEAYDATTNLQLAPTGGDESNMDNVAFSADPFSWQDGVLAAGDWIVLESAHVANPFHLYMRLASSSTLEMFLLPLGDFVAGEGLTDEKPDFATQKKIGSGGAATAVTMTGFATPANYIAVADEERLILVFDNGTAASMSFMYLGQLDGARSFMTPADTSPYVIYDSPNHASMGSGASFCRLSPLDSDTVLTGGVPSAMSNGYDGTPLHLVAANDGLGGANGVLPLGVFFGSVAGHIHFAGFLRYCGTVSMSVGPVGTLGGMTNLVVNDRLGSFPGVGILWDGATPYPS